MIFKLELSLIEILAMTGAGFYLLAIAATDLVTQHAANHCTCQRARYAMLVLYRLLPRYSHILTDLPWRLDSCFDLVDTEHLGIGRFIFCEHVKPGIGAARGGRDCADYDPHENWLIHIITSANQPCVVTGKQRRLRRAIAARTRLKQLAVPVKKY